MSTPPDIRRRQLLLGGTALPLAGWSLPSLAERQATAARDQLRLLEADFKGRLGVFALDAGSGEHLGHRADERFPLCSTFKMMLAAAVLGRSVREPRLLQQRLPYSKRDLVSYSPITAQHVGAGMTVAALCEATVQVSDNTAANVLMKRLGGPAAVTAFARSIGDESFRLDRWETELNTALPGDARDTTTPDAMVRSLQRLALGEALPALQRAQLQDWLRGATTGAERIRAGVPADWRVGDKTGTGDHGTANDIAVIWPPHRAPLVLAVYTTQPSQDAKPRNEVLAAAARIVASWAG
ncbi:MAG TPA: class A beta-lactamase [Ideonella sp.]|uniref:class A beta-lactamase n=1 Tax=Ideonella sp. TaxID=1929293 RepID=UPI002E33DBEF|nr:class A beta-lactamase [Ideonella sp.]HEX5682973.1 class A beta-lactamase [Ideonella sp.]